MVTFRGVTGRNPWWHELDHALGISESIYMPAGMPVCSTPFAVGHEFFEMCSKLNRLKSACFFPVGDASGYHNLMVLLLTCLPGSL